MKKRLLYTITYITLLCACKQTSEFYNPDSIISERYEIPTDTIYNDNITGLSARVRFLNCIDNYLIITQINKDSIFQVMDIKNGSIISNFGCKGHARNEFIYPRTIYCRKDKNGLPLLFVLDGICTKIIDIEKSIETNKCILKDIIKEDVDIYFNHTFHVGDNAKFIYKQVSYEDARDAVYIPPLYYLVTGDTKFEWNIHPNIINPEWSNMVDAAYSNVVWIKPDGSKAISVPNFIDIVNIFDLSKKKVLGIVNPDSYTYNFIDHEGSESTIKEHLRYFNTSACVTDNCFIILKDGNLYKDILGETDEDRCSYIYIYDWNGKLQKSYVLDKNLLHIAYNEKNKQLYAISIAHKLYRYNLK